MRRLLAPLLMLAAVLLGACSTRRDAVFRNGPPGQGLRELLNQGSEPLHIVFMHGMRATRSGGSAAFRAALCARLRGCKQPAAEQTAGIPLRAVDVSYLGTPVWRNAEEWEKSFATVHRYVYANEAGPPVVVEEVNWWPLLLPIKCRFVVRRDAALAGVSATQLEVCSAQGPFADGEHYPWLTAHEAQDIAAKAGVTGGGAKLNRALKTEIMDWGLSDAVIATGPMGEIIGQAIGGAFAWAATTPVPGSPSTPGAARRFAVVSESLGSFVVFDYYERHHDQGAAFKAAPDRDAPDEARAAFGLVQVLDNADRLYFLANQVALLELARLEVRPPSAPGAFQAPAPVRGLLRWGRTAKPGSGAGFDDTPDYGQVVAFHDPNDILTYEAPPIPGGAAVHNVFLANGPTYLGLLADPALAHTAHARNSCVLDIIFDKVAKGPCKVAPAN